MSGDTDLFSQRFLGDILHFKKVAFCALLQNILVTGGNGINQIFSQRLTAIPDLARGGFFYVDLGAVLGHKALEQNMSFLKLFAEFIPPFLGILTEYGERTLVVTRRVHFKIHIVLFQQTMKVGKLCDHTNRSENGKGRSQNAVGDTCLLYTSDAADE